MRSCAPAGAVDGFGVESPGRPKQIMPLSPGTRLGHYDVTALLGEGGMGHSRNVKRWRSGTMVVRWVSAAIVEAEKTFRRVHGWRDITTLVSALAVLEAKEEASAERVA